MTNTAPTDDSRARIDRYLKNELLTERAHRIEALAGDASERHYFRLWVEGLSPRVVVIYPEGAGGALDAFVSVAGLLATMPVPVPRMIARADELGLLVLEDLGDVSLQRHLQEAAPAERAGRYRDASRSSIGGPSWPPPPYRRTVWHSMKRGCRGSSISSPRTSLRDTCGARLRRLSARRSPRSSGD